MVGYHLKDNYEVTLVSDGWEAVYKLYNEDPAIDLILTDIEMPELNGLELMEILDETSGLNQIPVIVMSSLIGDQTSLDLDFQNYYGSIPKPIVPTELFLKIEEAFVSKMG